MSLLIKFQFFWQKTPEMQSERESEINIENLETVLANSSRGSLTSANQRVQAPLIRELVGVNSHTNLSQIIFRDKKSHKSCLEFQYQQSYKHSVCVCDNAN